MLGVWGGLLKVVRGGPSPCCCSFVILSKKLRGECVGCVIGCNRFLVIGMVGGRLMY